jgi:hypothetical protein
MFSALEIFELNSTSIISVITHTDSSIDPEKRFLKSRILFDKKWKMFIDELLISDFWQKFLYSGFEIRSNIPFSMNEFFTYAECNNINIERRTDLEIYLKKHYDVSFILKDITGECLTAANEKIIDFVLLKMGERDGEKYITAILQLKRFSLEFSDLLSNLTLKYVEAIHNSSGYIFLDYQFTE